MNTDYEKIAKTFDLLAEKMRQKALEETLEPVSKDNYNQCTSRIELCDFIKNTLNPIYSMIGIARKNEMNFALNGEVDPQDFDSLYHEIAKAYRLCDSIQMTAGAEDHYDYSAQGKSFD